MSNRLKEDEKNERVIRGLLKLQPNRRCINCNSLGPQYVCTNFWTFICTNCSGIHREFTHRVKSVSMAKFTSQEVSALQEGGNQRAKEIYFKEWDAQRNSFPDSNNVDRLRDFIRHIYVDRRFTGERTYDKDKPLKGTAGDNENRSVETSQGGSKSPPYERRYDDRSSSGGRSPGYDQDSRQYGDFKRGSGYPPVVNDWRREDRRISDGDYKVESQFPQPDKDPDSSSSPVVRPVRDILGENVTPLRIIEPPKPNSGRTADGSAMTQRTASSSSLASSNTNPAQEDIKLETIRSLIDFDADPEPPVAPAIPQAQQTTMPQPSVQQANPSDANWASFDVAPGAKATPSPTNINTLESVLSQLSVPASLPAQVPVVQGPHAPTAIPEGSVMTLPGTDASFVTPAGAVPGSAFTSASGPASVSSFSAFPPVSASAASAGQWASFQHQQPLFPATVQSTTQQFTPPAGGTVNNQPWNITSVPTVQGHPSTPMPHGYHNVSKPANVAVSSVVSQASSVEVNPSGRKELPEDLFTVKYPYSHAPVPGWQMGHPHGLGISMQYNYVVPTPSFPQQSGFPQPSKSTNPFDVGSESSSIRAPTFPSMSSLQGALPSLQPSAAMHPSGLGYPTHAWTRPPSFYASALGPRAYMGQQMPTNVPIPRQEVGSFGAGQQSSTFPTNTTPHPYPGGGNPFG